MKVINFVKASLLLPLFVLNAGCESNAPTAEQNSAKPNQVEKVKKPNIVIIFADDLGYGDISSFGAEGIRTPNIDSIGKEGFISRDFFIPANVCSPSRASLLTGRYPMRNGVPLAVHANKKHRNANYGLSADEVTLPEMLKASGYRSLVVGKWHLGWEQGSHPLDAGFDEHFGLISNYHHTGKNNARYEYMKDFDSLYRGREKVAENVDLRQVTKRYTDEVIDFIEREKDGPFFVYFAHNIVHAPHRPRAEFEGTSEKGKYGDFIHEMDYSTGRVLAALERLGLEEDTLVIFTSDNGANYSGDNGILNGVKYTTMEGGHRVPAMFKWPGVIPAGQDSNTTLSSMDIFPLIADITGSQMPADRVIDGKNIIGVLRGEETESPHKVLYYYNGTNLQAIRKGKWKLHLPRTVADQPFWNENEIGGRIYVELDKPMLFNLATDTGERHDVADKYPEILASFNQDIKYAREVLGDVNVIGSDQRVPPMKNPQKINRWWVKNKTSKN
ncbi:sulfatase [Gayadomonas joobiniege]|uniref:sulfatase family protein n=1 Tax=Gayadomonas joobiniege TaxID=1234606 RepID=UPI00035E19D4|nr:sulfatase [Gayadomonas joobiniege]